MSMIYANTFFFFFCISTAYKYTSDGREMTAKSSGLNVYWQPRAAGTSSRTARNHSTIIGDDHSVPEKCLQVHTALGS